MSIIYKITNTINGKSYIGQTVKTLAKRWYYHYHYAKNNKNHFHDAILKYGTDCWSFEILEEVNDNNLLNEREIYWIVYYDTFKSGYNSTIGGEGRIGYKCSDIIKEKIKLNHANVSGEKNPNYGKKHKTAVIEKMRKKKLRNKHCIGRKYSEETIEKMRLSAIKRWNKDQSGNRLIS